MFRACGGLCAHMVQSLKREMLGVCSLFPLHKVPGAVSRNGYHCIGLQYLDEHNGRPTNLDADGLETVLTDNAMEPLSRPAQWVRGGEIFQFSARYTGVTTMTQEVQLKTKLYLEFSEITKDGNCMTL